MKFLNKEYENEIVKCFKDCLKEVDNKKVELVNRKIQFALLFSEKRKDVFQKYRNSIKKDIIDWSSYDGKVILFYEPFKKIESMNKTFYIKEMFGILI